MSTLSLHSRYLWTMSYTQLETTRDLTHRLKYSTAMLEKHLLKRTSLPIAMVRTNAKKHLLYLDDPDGFRDLNDSDQQRTNIFSKFISYPAHHGY